MDEIAVLKQQIKELTARRNLLEEELSVAVNLKYYLMPGNFPAFPDVPEIDIFADMLSIEQMGGDFYDFFRIDADHIGIVIADIFDGGKKAALYMVAFKMYLKNAVVVGDSVEDRIETVNDLLCWGNKADLSLSAWYGVYEISTGIFRIVNAGHEKAMLLSDHKVFSYDEQVSYLLGVIDGMQYESFEIKMEKGEKLLLYTDGVTSARNAKGEKYSRKRLLKAYKETADKIPEETIAYLQNDLKQFVGDMKLKEDATFLCLERKVGEDE